MMTYKNTFMRAYSLLIKFLLQRFSIVTKQRSNTLILLKNRLKRQTLSNYKSNHASLPRDFDWLAYVQLNDDLRHIKTKTEAINHYLAYGIREGRHYRKDFPSWISRTGIPFADSTRIQDGLCLIGYLHSEIGLGQAARNIAYALDIQRFPLSFKNVYLPNRENDFEFKTKTNGLTNRKINLMVFGLPAVESIEPDIGSGGYNILYSFWELGKIPENWLQKVGQFDEIWVPSRFGAQAFPTDFNVPVRVVRLPVIRPAILVADKIATSDDNHELRCLNFFDFDSYISRKNPKAVIDAFQAAFPASKRDVRLTVKTRGNNDQGLRLWLAQTAAKDNRIQVIDQTMNRQQIDKLICDSDVFISLHRSEGFGFGAADALAAGKAVVSTNYSATSEFVTQETGYPVDYDLIPVKKDEYPGFNGQVWAEPRLDSAVDALRSIYYDRELSRVKGRAGINLMESLYSPEVIGRQMVILLSGLSKKSLP